ncbi:MAG: amidohydrolase [Anaerolineales bacterium]
MTTITLTNARVYTMDSGNPFAIGLVIEDGRIIRLISEAEGIDLTLSGNVLDLEGRVLLPGLIDSHLHLQKYAETLEIIDCETSTRQKCLERVKERAANTPPGDWVLGHGWNHNNWADGYGNAGELDQIAPDHAVYLTGKSLHVSWVNNQALALAGINAETRDPATGSFQRDQNGIPTGIIFEGAVKLVERVIPVPSIKKTASTIFKTQKKLWEMGLTGVHDFDRELCLDALIYLENEGKLGLRVQKSIPELDLDQALELGYRIGGGTDWLWFGGVKDFADGALGPQTAAMLAPYQGSDNLGLLLRSEEELYELGVRAAGGKLALSIHAIGDLANRTVLNAFTKLRQYEKKQGIKPLAHRIEHLQLIDPEDIGRLADLDITASMQPIHATSDMEMADSFWGTRTAYAYAPKHLLDQGTRVIFGSDAPVESPNPWLGIHAAVTRRRGDGSPGPDGWHPGGRVSVHEALKAFTQSPAEASGKGDKQGKLAPDYWADCIVLEKDPLHCHPDELLDIQPAGTMINGNWVYRNF